jgi:hypothetical protein
MRSKSEFIKLVDSRFFNHLNTKSLIPFNEKGDRKEFLKSVYDKLLDNLTNYKPQIPRKYISIPKNRYVIRMVPSFELDDYCIYYFCLKVLGDYIAENRVDGTFGGFRLGGKLREKENEEFEPSFEDSYNENSFNIFAWKQEYGEYQTKLRKLSSLMGNKFRFAVQFDIANFYDCIRIDLLEDKIRKRIADSSCNDEIYLLVRFLKYWNCKYDLDKSVGIPQDEVGDCSRILSNFFLQNYDQFMYDQCQIKDASYLRYADDQIIFTKCKEDAEELMFKASQKLFEESLNINTSKTKEFTNSQEFDDVYGFSIFEKLKFDDQDINQAFELFVIKKDLHSGFRESSVLKRMLHDKIQIENLYNQNRIKLLAYLWDENFLLFSDSHYMMQIYKMLKDDGEKTEYLNTLDAINIKTLFESYKINYQKFIKQIIY